MIEYLLLIAFAMIAALVGVWRTVYVAKGIVCMLRGGKRK